MPARAAATVSRWTMGRNVSASSPFPAPCCAGASGRRCCRWKEFHRFPDHFIHRSSQKTDTGLEIDLLQEYVFIPLDIFRGILHNEGIKDKLYAWLTFLSVDEPEMIIKLITEYPQFKAYYEEIYQLCRDTEKVMEMFSKELQELDRNTVQYMIDEMQDVIDRCTERGFE